MVIKEVGKIKFRSDDGYYQPWLLKDLYRVVAIIECLCLEAASIFSYFVTALKKLLQWLERAVKERWTWHGAE